MHVSRTRAYPCKLADFSARRDITTPLSPFDYHTLAPYCFNRLVFKAKVVCDLGTRRIGKWRMPVGEDEGATASQAAQLSIIFSDNLVVTFGSDLLEKMAEKHQVR